MIDTSTHVATTPGIMLLRVGQAGSALRWDPAGRCWRWPDPQGGQLYAWPAPAGMPSGLRLMENACVMACCGSGRVLLGQGKRLGMVDLPPPGQARRITGRLAGPASASSARPGPSAGRCRPGRRAAA